MDCYVEHTISTTDVDLSSDDRWSVSSPISRSPTLTKTDIQERRKSNDAYTPRSISRHDSKASLQDPPVVSSPWSQHMSYAAQQRSLYTPKTSVRDRPTKLTKSTSKSNSTSSDQKSVNTKYVSPSPYDSANLFAALQHRKRSSMEASLPPRPEPYPEDFEGLKTQELDSSVETFTRNDHCERCGTKLRRRSFSSSIVEYACPRHCSELKS